MHEILHYIRLDARPESVFDALTTEEGLKCWWTTDVEAVPEEESVAIFGFNGRSVVFRMRVERLVRPELVRWTCLGDFDEWQGTLLEFVIEEVEPGTCELTFSHSGWRSTRGSFPQCNTDWGRLMYFLKDYVEGRSDRPMMS